MYLNPERTTFVCFLIHTVAVTGVTHYCEQGNTVSIANEITGTIRTVVSGKSHYDNNLNCDWIIDGGINNLIQITVTGLDLQFAPGYTSCGGYDNLSIRDGNISSAREITAICGEKNPYEVISSGRYLYLKFYSNDKNFYNHVGVTLTFTVFDGSGCPPYWINSTSSNQCYRIRKQPSSGSNFFSGYNNCLLSQGNLAIIDNQELLNDLQNYATSESVSSAWVGLTDIGEEGTLLWLNDEKAASWMSIEGNIEDYDCGIVDFSTQKFKIKDCKNDKHFLLCQRPNGGAASITYQLPEEKEKTDTEVLSLRWKVILGISGGVAIIIAIFGAYCFLTRKSKPSAQSSGAISLSPQTTTNRSIIYRASSVGHTDRSSAENNDDLPRRSGSRSSHSVQPPRYSDIDHRNMQQPFHFRPEINVNVTVNNTGGISTEPPPSYSFHPPTA